MNLLNFFYPPRCRHCHCLLKAHAFLCSDCLRHLEYAPLNKHPCHVFVQVGCFRPYGPIMTLAKSKEPGVAKVLAALMIVHFSKLNWPQPSGIYGNSDLCFAMRRMLKLKRIYRQICDQIIFVPSIYPLSYPEKKKLFLRFPRTILSLTLLDEK